METLTHLLFLVSTSLLFPVALAILVLLAWTVVLLGGFLREALARGHVRRGLEACLAGLGEGRDPWEALGRIPSELCRSLSALLARGPRDKGSLCKALLDLENTVAASMARLSFCTRVGPMLGLMGTLIPLGPALMGLAQGDMRSLSSNLIVAFTTTVVGLLISGLAFGMSLARRTWYSRDLADLEYLLERLGPGEEGR